MNAAENQEPVRRVLDPAVEHSASRPVRAPTWAPGDACTLPTADQPLREAEFDELFATALRGMQRPEPGRLRLLLEPGVEATARDLVARESSCCSFFDFRFTREGGQLVLDVRVPRERVPVLDGIVRQAQPARQRAVPGVIE